MKRMKSSFCFSIRRILSVSCFSLYFHAHRREEHRPEASGEHQQVPYPPREARRQTARHLLHRQPAERCQRPGGTQHELDV